MFPAYLVRLYHSMRAAGSVMEAARVRSRELAARCPVAARLEPYWAEHIGEEEGHHEWIEADLLAFGVDPGSALADVPSADVAALMGTLRFWAEEVHPVGALAYFYLVESGPPPIRLLDWLVDARGLPRDGLSTFYRHAEIDLAHGRRLRALIDELPLTGFHSRLLTTSAVTVLGQLTGILDGLRPRF